MNIFRKHSVDRQTGFAETVNEVGAAALPSPARRSALQLNPFFKNNKKYIVRPVTYKCAGKFQRILPEGCRIVLPSELRILPNTSFTVSGDSTRNFNSLASFSCDLNCSKESQSVSFLKSGPETYCDAKNEDTGLEKSYGLKSPIDIGEDWKQDKDVLSPDVSGGIYFAINSVQTAANDEQNETRARRFFGPLRKNADKDKQKQRTFFNFWRQKLTTPANQAPITSTTAVVESSKIEKLLRHKPFWGPLMKTRKPVETGT